MFLSEYVDVSEYGLVGVVDPQLNAIRVELCGKDFTIYVLPSAYCPPNLWFSSVLINHKSNIFAWLEGVSFSIETVDVITVKCFGC